MFTKTATLTFLALIATTSPATAQQMPKHTAFTNPVDGSAIYSTGQNTTFSRTMACRQPSTAVSTGSSRDVEIDCSKERGKEYWVVPEVADNEAKYSLRIMLNRPIYSGQFKIQAKAGGSNIGETTVTADKQAEKHTDNGAGALVATGVLADLKNMSYQRAVA
ncbi:hypothetical protein BGW39_011050 [Mortierella sp. 14UC]|nr:hypothetical protein BGW39_011050 [Mortierella sp. 14UC]